MKNILFSTSLFCLCASTAYPQLEEQNASPSTGNDTRTVGVRTTYMTVEEAVAAMKAVDMAAAFSGNVSAEETLDSSNSTVSGVLYGGGDVRAQNPVYTGSDGTSHAYDVRGGKLTATGGDAAAGVLVRGFDDDAAKGDPRVEYGVFELESLGGSAFGLLHQPQGDASEYKGFYGISDSKFYVTADGGGGHMAAGVYHEMGKKSGNAVMGAYDGSSGIFKNNTFEVNGTGDTNAYGIYGGELNVVLEGNVFNVASASGNACGIYLVNGVGEKAYSDYLTGIGSGNTIAATVTEGKNNGEGTTAVGIYLDSTIQTSIAGENTISARNEGTTPGNKAVGMYITQNAHVDGGIRDAVISAWSAGDAAIGIAMDYCPDTGNISTRIHDLTNVTISATSEKGRAIGVGVSFTDPTLTQSGYKGTITGEISVAARGDVFGFVYGRNVSGDLSVGGIALYSENTGDSYHFAAGLSEDLTLKATSLGHSAGTDSGLNPPSGNRAYGFYVGDPDGGLSVSYGGEIKLQLQAEAQGAAYGVFAYQNAWIGGVNQVSHVTVNSISDSAYGIYASLNSTIGTVYGLQGAVTVTTAGTGKAYGVYLEDGATAGDVYGSIDLESALGTSVGVYKSTGAKAGRMSGDMTIRSHGEGASYGVFYGGGFNLETSSIGYYNAETGDSSGFIFGSGQQITVANKGEAYGAYIGAGSNLADSIMTHFSVESETSNAYGLYVEGTVEHPASAASLDRARLEAKAQTGSAYGIYATGNSKLENVSACEIAASGTGAASAYGIYADGNSTIKLTPGNVSATSEAAAYGVYVKDNAGASLTGDISATGATASVGVYSDSTAGLTFAGAATVTARNASGQYGDSLRSAGNLTVHGTSETVALTGNIATPGAVLTLADGTYSLSADSIDAATFNVGSASGNASLNIKDNVSFTGSELNFYAASKNDYSRITIDSGKSLDLSQLSGLNLLLGDKFSTAGDYLGLIQGKINGLSEMLAVNVRYVNESPGAPTLIWNTVYNENGFGVQFGPPTGLVIKDDPAYGNIEQDVFVVSASKDVAAKGVEITRSTVGDVSANIGAQSTVGNAYGIWVDDLGGAGGSILGTVSGTIEVSGVGEAVSYGVLLGEEAGSKDSVGLYNAATRNSEGFDIDWAHVNISAAAATTRGGLPYSSYGLYSDGGTYGIDMTETDIGGKISASNAGGSAAGIYAVASDWRDLLSTARIEAIGTEGSEVWGINLAAYATMSTFEHGSEISASTTGKGGATGLLIQLSSWTERISSKISASSESGTACGIDMQSDAVVYGSGPAGLALDEAAIEANAIQGSAYGIRINRSIINGAIENTSIVAASAEGDSYALYLDNVQGKTFILSGDTSLKGKYAVYNNGNGGDNPTVQLKKGADGTSNLRFDGAVSGVNLKVDSGVKASFDNFSSASGSVKIDNEGALVMKAGSTLADVTLTGGGCFQLLHGTYDKAAEKLAYAANSLTASYLPDAKTIDFGDEAGTGIDTFYFLNGNRDLACEISFDHSLSNMALNTFTFDDFVVNGKNTLAGYATTMTSLQPGSDLTANVGIWLNSPEIASLNDIELWKGVWNEDSLVWSLVDEEMLGNVTYDSETGFLSIANTGDWAAYAITAAVPEPATCTMLLGAFAFGLAYRRRK